MVGLVGVWYRNSDVRVEERPRPEPGPGEILVRIASSGLCGSDVLDLNNPGLDDLRDDPQPSEINSAATGLIVGGRIGYGNPNGYVSMLGILGRESYNFEYFDPHVHSTWARLGITYSDADDGSTNLQLVLTAVPTGNGILRWDFDPAQNGCRAVSPGRGIDCTN